MEDKNERENRLFIPQGMKAEREWYEGFGKRELMQAAWGFIGIAFLALLSYLLFGNMIYVVVVLLFGATGVIAMVTRSPMTNLSGVDHLVLIYRYWTRQQHYTYQQMEEERSGEDT